MIRNQRTKNLLRLKTDDYYGMNIKGENDYTTGAAHTRSTIRVDDQMLTQVSQKRLSHYSE